LVEAKASTAAFNADRLKVIPLRTVHEEDPRDR
jgi:hypothetical protein